MEILTFGLLGLAVGGMIVAYRSRNALARKLTHGTLHDALTDLPNRAMLEGRIETALARAKRNAFKVAVLLVDLDRFRDVNNTMGHGLGDELLKTVSERIRTCLREEDTLARLSSDEFAILLEQVADETSPARVSERVLEKIREPFEIDGRQILMTAAIGIVVSVDGRAVAPQLVRDADVAMHRAKLRGRGHYEMFDASMSTTAKHRLTLEAELRAAVDNGEFLVHYQPQFDLDSGDVIGFEGLIRWEHPTRGLLLPADFIPVAEQTGLIEPIGRWVLEEVCRAGLRMSRTAQGGRPTIAVNMSGKQLQMESRLEELVNDVLQRTGLPAEQLTLEITESVFVGSGDPCLDALRRIRSLGVGIAIDDFGIGYSSLSYLKYLPVSVLKLDKVFVHGLANHVDSEIVRSLLGLAASLGITVCAEGIETADQAKDLRSLGCTTGQGRVLSPPVAEDVAASLLSSFFPEDRTADTRLG